MNLTALRCPLRLPVLIMQILIRCGSNNCASKEEEIDCEPLSLLRENYLVKAFVLWSNHVHCVWVFLNTRPLR